jgi:hypothetical protein
MNIGDMSSPRWATGAGELDALRAENTKLRAELEAMTTGHVSARYIDWKVTARKPGNDTWESTGTIRNDEPLAKRRLQIHRDMGTFPILYRRFVRVIEGPWVEVKDGDNE